jgi:threonylcarbamoyladenosine tRNA methylthiotransferase MtaB
LVLQSFDRGARAWLKVQDGCDEHCTFCATTLARGESRSRAPQEIVEEALALGTHHQEIVLTGVHIGAYGADREDGVDLSSLVERLVHRVPRTRFRLTSVEATQVNDHLLDIMAAAPDRLAPHLHAPLQSGSDEVLRRMGRHWYTAATYRARIERLAERLDPLGLGADIMVGFPTETDRDFALTRRVVEELPFTYVHVFPYSERTAASAHRIGPPVDPQLAAARSAELRAIVDEKAAKHRRARAGKYADVVLLRRSAGQFEGLTEDYLPVVGKTDQELPPRFDSRLSLDPEARLKATPLEDGR